MAYETFETIQRFWQRFCARSSRPAARRATRVAAESRTASASLLRARPATTTTAFIDLVGLGKEGAVPFGDIAWPQARRRFRRRGRSEPAACRGRALLHLPARAHGRVPGRRGAAPALSRRPDAHPARPGRARPLSAREVAAAALRAAGPPRRLYARLQLRQGAAPGGRHRQRQFPLSARRADDRRSRSISATSPSAR